MRSYSRKRKNNIIIGTLCGVMLLMVVGYAAFASQLNIKGTSGISSNWNIEITNIRGGNPDGGDAYDISEPTYTPTTATFNTGLKTPGTLRVYEVEVTNKGTLEGLVTIANLTCGDNEAIGCEVFELDKKIVDDNWNNIELPEEPNGIDYFEQGKQDYTDIAFTLPPGEKHYIYVMVRYNNVTSQPENLSANINLELTYEQDGATGGNITLLPTDYTGTVYRWSTKRLEIGDSITGLNVTTDYQTLNKKAFLKHTVANGKIETADVCFIKDDQEHCLSYNDYGVDPNINKNKLLEIFGEDSCTTYQYYMSSDDLKLSCSDGAITAEVVLKRVSGGFSAIEVIADGKTTAIYSYGESKCGYHDGK